MKKVSFLAIIFCLSLYGCGVISNPVVTPEHTPANSVSEIEGETSLNETTVDKFNSKAIEIKGTTGDVFELLASELKENFLQILKEDAPLGEALGNETINISNNYPFVELKINYPAALTKTFLYYADGLSSRQLTTANTTADTEESFVNYEKKDNKIVVTKKVVNFENGTSEEIIEEF